MVNSEKKARFATYIKKGLNSILFSIPRTYQLMLSRRNIRIKVLQVLYAYGMDETLTQAQLATKFNQSVDEAFKIYIYNLLVFTKVAEQVLKEASNRATKHIQTDEDKVFSTSIFENDLMQSLINNDGYRTLLKRHSLEAMLDSDTNKLLYNEFIAHNDWATYQSIEAPTNEDHLKIMLRLYKVINTSETFFDHIDDRFGGWVHDKSLVIGAIKKTLKALPAESAFYEEFIPDAATCEEFGEDLLYKVVAKENELLDEIAPALRNWDPSRVANVDMVLLKMALAEMLYFPTIPPKVTINEFVDISKIYSTPKSKEFINGVLDRLMRKLSDENKLNKEGRGLID